MKMDKRYLIEFVYGVKDVHCFEVYSSGDFSVASDASKNWLAEMIEIFIRDKNLHEDGKLAHDAVLRNGEGEMLFSVVDFSNL